MIVAGITTVICHRLKQPVVLGYIIAGVIIGPHTPPFPLIEDEKTIRTLAELGLVFLMFSLGLEFSLRKLRKVGFTALTAATLVILLMTWLGYEIGRAFGWKTMDCIFLGAMISISSTTIMVKALGELGLTKEKFAELIFGILIVEDILAIVMIALLSGIAMTGGLAVADILGTIGKLGIFVVTLLVLGLLAVPRLLRYVARFKSNEMLLITVLGLCFGVSLMAVKLNYSVALGAFIIGAVIAESREIHRIESLTEPLRDMFSAVFFVAIGLLIEPALLARHWLPVVVITIAVIFGQILTCAFGTFISGHDTRTSLRVGIGLAQIGEFSFIIASLGLTLKVTSEFLYPVAVTVSAITTLINPYLIKNSDKLVNWFDRVAPPRFISYLGLYTRWIAAWREARHASMATRLIKRWTWLMILNLVLVAGIFVGATFLATHPPDWIPYLPGGAEGVKATLWLAAIVLALPLLVATYRKLQALGLLVGELAAEKLKNESRAAGVQAIIANTIPFAGALSMGLVLLVLSAGLLPSWRILIVLSVLVAVMTALFWRTLIRIYSKGQVALEETFAETPLPKPAEPPSSLAGILKEAQLETFVITVDSPAAGKLIGELALRTQTGASIVGIERLSGLVINPGPDEEIQNGDQVLMLGRAEQLSASRRLLLAPRKAQPPEPP